MALGGQNLKWAHNTLNSSQEAFGNIQLASVKYETVAFCSSSWCAGHGFSKIRTTADSNDQCKRCSHLVVYKQVRI